MNKPKFPAALIRMIFALRTGVAAHFVRPNLSPVAVFNRTIHLKTCQLSSALTVFLSATAFAQPITVDVPLKGVTCLGGGAQGWSCGATVPVGELLPKGDDVDKVIVLYHVNEYTLHLSCFCTNHDVFGTYVDRAHVHLIDGNASVIASNYIIDHAAGYLCWEGSCSGPSHFLDDLTQEFVFNNAQGTNEIHIGISGYTSDCQSCSATAWVYMDGFATVIIYPVPIPSTRIRSTIYPDDGSGVGVSGSEPCMTYEELYELQQTQTPEIRQDTLDNNLPVGMVNALNGQAWYTRDNVILPVVFGMDVYLWDDFQTGPNATLNIVFEDGTNQPMDPKKKLLISELVTSPILSKKAKFGWLRKIYVWVSDLAERVHPTQRNPCLFPYAGTRASADDYTNPALMIERTSVAVAGGQSPPSLMRHFFAPQSEFNINFDYLMLQEDGTLTVSVDGEVVGTYGYFDMEQSANGYERKTISLDGTTYWGSAVRPLSLKFSLDGSNSSRVLIDNVTGPGFTNSGFEHGSLPWHFEGEGEAILIGTNVDQYCISTGVFNQGPFQSLLTGMASGTIRQIASADLNGDGIMDLAALHDNADSNGSTFNYEIRVGLGAGDGTFQQTDSLSLGVPAIADPTYDFKFDMKLADLTGDGKVDVIFNRPYFYDWDTEQGYPGGLFVAAGIGNGTFQTSTLLAGTDYDGFGGVECFALADVDADQFTDILLVGNGPISALKNLGGSFDLPIEIAGFGATFIHAGHFNADEHIDFMAHTHQSSGATVVFNNGDGTFGPEVNVPLGGFSMKTPIVADFNDDGFDDLAAVNFSSLSIVLNNGAGGFDPAVLYAVPSIAYRFATGDVNGDGLLDIIAPSPGTWAVGNLRILLGDGEGNFTVTTGPQVGKPSALLVTDMTRNGAQDIVGVHRVNFNGCDPVPPTEPVPGDITGDGIVNVIDLLAIINAWGACAAPPQSCDADIAPPPSGDGQVNVIDLLMVINNWG